jgi:uncharacterized OB-fold protein
MAPSEHALRAVRADPLVKAECPNCGSICLSPCFPVKEHRYWALPDAALCESCGETFEPIIEWRIM